MKKIQGIIPPMITPLLDEATIDEAGAKRIADRMIDAGVAAIFILGTTGESQSISMRWAGGLSTDAKVFGRFPFLQGAPTILAYILCQI